MYASKLNFRHPATTDHLLRRLPEFSLSDRCAINTGVIYHLSVIEITANQTSDKNKYICIF